MKDEIYYIELSRKAIHKQLVETEDKQIFNNEAANIYCATDYFDILKVEEKDLTDELASVIGVYPRETEDAESVVVQSFALYCSEKRLEYEKNMNGNGNPFSSELNKDMPFLSIIQVHITPEIFVHAIPDKSSEILLEEVFKDLCQIVSNYIGSDYKQSSGIRFRIYSLISTGDYAVVIRSELAEASLQVSTLIRKRILSKKDNQDSERLVLYKTYTLLTLAAEENGEIRVLQGRKGVYVLRACYSNQYWSRKDKVELFLARKKANFHGKLFRLNGRYDFSVNLSEEEFYEILPFVKEYKLGAEEDCNRLAQFDPEEDGAFTIIDYMKYLMKYNYLSYINERYLAEDDRETGELSFSELALGEEEQIKVREDFLDIKILERCQAVQEQYKQVVQTVEEVKAYKKNLSYYVGLIEKLFVFCKGINCLSDTRIYAIVLLEQLEIILDSLEIYLELCKKEGAEGDEILDKLEIYVRESICVVDEYAKYVRNNNLQSLQTPNYNIESSVSMEKILIGYSEYLRVFTEAYIEIFNDILPKEQSYLPIVVPALEEKNVSVEVLFKKGFLWDWNAEKEIREKQFKGKKERYCMVIRIPTLRELVDVIGIFPTFFHEVAHQFRYEERKERNEFLLKYCTHRAMEILAKGIVRRLQDESGFWDYTLEMQDMLQECFTEAYQKFYFEEEKCTCSYLAAPLNNFKKRFQKDMNEYLAYWGRSGDVRLWIKEYLRELSYYINVEKQEHCEEVIYFKSLFDQLIETEEQDEALENVNIVIRGAYGIAWECAYSISEKESTLWKPGKFQNWVEENKAINLEENWEEDWEEEWGEDSDYQVIWKAFSHFADKIYDEFSSLSGIKRYNSQKRKTFLDRVYTNLCKTMRRKEEDSNKEYAFPLNLEIGRRLLGIDVECDENKKIFKRIVEDELEKYKFDMSEKAGLWIEEYREETADIVMCNVMGLKPFGYLYVLAVNWEDSMDLCSIHFKRMMNVMIFQFEAATGEKEKEADYTARMREIAEGILGELRASVSALWKPEYGCIHEPMETEMDTGDADEEEIDMKFIDEINKIKKECVSLKDILKGDRRVARELTYFTSICEMLILFVEYMPEYFGYLGKYQELCGDYAKGVNKLKEFQEEMYKNEKWEIRRLAKYCRTVAEVLNQPHKFMEKPEKYRELNCESIRFLLAMYYLNKRENAKKMRGWKRNDDTTENNKQRR